MHGLVQPELCFGFAKHQFFIRCVVSDKKLEKQILKADK